MGNYTRYINEYHIKKNLTWDKIVNPKNSKSPIPIEIGRSTMWKFPYNVTEIHHDSSDKADRSDEFYDILSFFIKDVNFKKLPSCSGMKLRTNYGSKVGWNVGKIQPDLLSLEMEDSIKVDLSNQNKLISLMVTRDDCSITNIPCSLKYLAIYQSLSSTIDLKNCPHLEVLIINSYYIPKGLTRKNLPHLKSLIFFNYDYSNLHSMINLQSRPFKKSDFKNFKKTTKLPSWIQDESDSKELVFVEMFVPISDYTKRMKSNNSKIRYKKIQII